MPSLRIQLAAAFFLLAVLPLGGMTLWSYLASTAALKRAVETEARVLADEMSGRVSEVATLLHNRVVGMRNRAAHSPGSAFERARQDALETAERFELNRLLPNVLTPEERRRGEVPFARDDDGHVHATSDGDLAILVALGLGSPPAADAVPPKVLVRPADWVVVKLPDEATGITLGVARPVGPYLEEIRAVAYRNLVLGLALVGLALLGILPLSMRMTNKLERLAAGVQELARGNLEARVPFRSHDEFGRLAEAFNTMALELKVQQQRLVAQERVQKELEMGRRIQLDLLPRAPLSLPYLQAHGVSIPAREVGGDFFNHFALGDNTAALLLGDVSGKGVPAALLMASLQATLRARLQLQQNLALMATEMDEEIFLASPQTVYLTLFVGLLEARSGLLRYVNAGHNPPIVLTREGAMEPLRATGRPLGLFPGGVYEEGSIRLAPGDRVIFYTDGVVEAENSLGEPFGVDRLGQALGMTAELDAAQVLDYVSEEVSRHRGEVEPGDDVTLMVAAYHGNPA